MNKITTFTNDLLDCEIRVTYKEGNPWFVAKDIAKALGYTDSTQAIRKHCKGGVETTLPSKGGKQSTKVIPEADLYRLILKSKKKEAEIFQDWVTEEILPAIRKTGKYSATPQNTSMIELAKAVLEQNGIIEDLKGKEQVFGNRTPVGQLSDITGCPKFIPVRGYLRSNRKYKELAITERQVALFTPA